MTSRTLYRWFSAIEDVTGLAYFPYPRTNRLGLQEVSVRIGGLRNPAVLRIIPFSTTFVSEVDLGSGRPWLVQSYWIPPGGTAAFRDYWRTARDLGLVREARVMTSRNTHFVFSPFETVVGDDGWVEARGDVDNRHFEDLLRRRLRESFEVRVGAAVADSPLAIPVILEHLWGRFSSRDVWSHMYAKDAEALRRYARKRTGAEWGKGAAIREIQQVWNGMIRRFDEVFLQPVVFLPPEAFRNAVLLCFYLRTMSVDRTVEFALRTSGHAVTVVVMPNIDPEGECRLWCLAPAQELHHVVRLLHEHHAGADPPAIAVVDIQATRELARPEFSRFDWRLFDPVALDWRYPGSEYIEALKGIS